MTMTINIAQINNGTYFETIEESMWNFLVLTTTANNPDVMIPAYQLNRLYFIIFIAYIWLGKLEWARSCFVSWLGIGSGIAELVLKTVSQLINIILCYIMLTVIEKEITNSGNPKAERDLSLYLLSLCEG